MSGFFCARERRVRGQTHTQIKNRHDERAGFAKQKAEGRQKAENEKTRSARAPPVI